MPKWLIVVFAFFILLLIGVNGYLFYSYFNFKKVPVVVPTPTEAPQEATLSGEIKPGWQLPQDQNYCSKSYYLVGSTKITEVRLSDALSTPLYPDLRIYSNTNTTVSGLGLTKDSSSCGDFVLIDNFESITNDPTSYTVDGTVACLAGDETDCIKTFQVGNAYIFLEGDNVNLQPMQVGDKVEVVGITDNNFISTQPYDGGIQVSSMKKI